MVQFNNMSALMKTSPLNTDIKSLKIYIYTFHYGMKWQVAKLDFEQQN